MKLTWEGKSGILWLTLEHVNSRYRDRARVVPKTTRFVCHCHHRANGLIVLGGEMQNLFSLQSTSSHSALCTSQSHTTCTLVLCTLPSYHVLLTRTEPVQCNVRPIISTSTYPDTVYLLSFNMK